MTERTVLLVAHTGRADVYDTAALAREKLAAAGIGLKALPGEGDGLGLECFDGPLDPAHPIDLVLAMGGDGTILRAAEQARPLDVPVLGINLGRVGFLAEVDLAHIDDAVTAIVDRQYRTTDRMTVDLEVEHEGRIVGTGWAWNEISVEKSSRERILDVVVEVDGHGVSAYGCDGVLCATPTGSTAYAFSAGGPVVWPGVDALLVTPLNAHALFARSLVVGPTATVSVHIDPDGPTAVVTCDGRRGFDIPPGARVFVRKGHQPVRMVRLNDQAFTDRLVRKFALPVHGWRQQRH
jgi:NAD+ kinase